MTYTEHTLVQQTTANYLEQQLGWTSVLAYNHEDFGPNSLLGRVTNREKFTATSNPVSWIIRNV